MLKCLKTDYLKTAKLLCYDLVYKSGNEEFDELLEKENIKYRLTLPGPSFLKKAINKIFKKEINLYQQVFDEIVSLRGKIKEVLGIKNSGEVKFLVRVDDFPRWDIPTEKFYKFYEILDKYKIQFLLGVTPFVCEKNLDAKSLNYRELTQQEIEFLRDAFQDGMIEIALHGYHHCVVSKKFKSEFIGLGEEEIKAKIEKALNVFKDFKIQYFIPPFNTIDEKNYFVLRNYFSVICGGKESIKYLGYYISPCCLYDRLYVASYAPVYSDAKNILNYVKTILKYEDNIIVPVTLHWSWELKSNFNYLEMLVKLISGRTLRWDKLLEIFMSVT